MHRIHLFSKNIPEIDLYFRKSSYGPEIKLVRNFVDYYADEFLSKNKRDSLAIFIEPRITSGFPDIVFACYNPNIFQKWNKYREELNTSDLKLFLFIHEKINTSGKAIIETLKLPEKQVICSLEKLLDAGLIMRNHQQWKAAKLSDIYGIKKLISVEAKINNMKKVAEQSFINTWFASQSYALSSTKNTSSDMLAEFKRYGVGLYHKDKTFKKILEARKFSLPSSYISLQFNEWIGKALY
ncbi:MAG: hypothetical protein MR993_02515 [Spirochaetes bacterium]|nr:hypothetical protein [Spirochaetota bacterium]